MKRNGRQVKALLPILRCAVTLGSTMGCGAPECADEADCAGAIYEPGLDGKADGGTLAPGSAGTIVWQRDGELRQTSQGDLLYNPKDDLRHWSLLEPATGTPRFTIPFDTDMQYVSVTDKGDPIFGTGHRSYFEARSRQNGAKLWSAVTTSGNSWTGCEGKELFFSGDQNRILAIRKSDGRAVWTYQPGGYTDCYFLDAERAYLKVRRSPGSQAFKISAVRLQDGREAWSVPVAEDPPTDIHWLGDARGVLALDGSRARRLDAAEGRVLWTYQYPDASRSLAFAQVITSGAPEPRVLIYANQDGKALALDLKTGAVAWSHAGKPMDSSFEGLPGGETLVTERNGDLANHMILAPDGKVRLRLSGDPAGSRAVLIDAPRGGLYRTDSGGGAISQLDRSTGGVKWTFTATDGSVLDNLLGSDGDEVFLAYQAPRYYDDTATGGVLALSRSTGTLLWRSPSREPSFGVGLIAFDASRVYLLSSGQRGPVSWFQQVYAVNRGRASVDTAVYHQIRVRHTGQCLTVADYGVERGALLVQAGCSGTDAQQFRIQKADGGFVEIIARHSGKALDVAGFDTANGGKVQQWDVVHKQNQQWRLVPAGLGSYRIENRHSGKVLDVVKSSPDEGASVHQWTYGGGDNQKWTFAVVPSTLRSFDDGRRYVLESPWVRKCLTAERRGEGSALVLQPCDAADLQTWKLAATSGGHYKLVSRATAQVASVENASTADNAILVQAADRNLPSQLWTVRPIGRGLARIASKQTGKVLAPTATSPQATEVKVRLEKPIEPANSWLLVLPDGPIY